MTIRRLLLISAWLASLALAYVAGTRQDAGAALEIAAPPGPEAPENPPVAVATDALERALMARDWPRAAELALARDGFHRLRRAALALAEQGDVAAAVALLETYAAGDPGAPAQFTLADVLLMSGDQMAALEPLFRIIDYPPTQNDAEEARRRLALHIGALRQQFVNADDTGRLVALYTWLSERDPGYDAYRLELVRWLLRDGDTEGAEHLFRQVGFVGVEQADLDAMARELALAQAGTPIERVGAAYFAQAHARGRGAREQPLRLLVDTGATRTGFAITALRRLGAQRLDRRVRVATANGQTVLELYQVRDLRVGGVEIGDLEVMALRDSPGGADGLLGMDVLDQVMEPVGTL